MEWIHRALVNTVTNLCSIKCWEVLEELNNLGLLKKASAPWSLLS
jgi:hypothetical protein